MDPERRYDCSLYTQQGLKASKENLKKKAVYARTNGKYLGVNRVNLDVNWEKGFTLEFPIEIVKTGSWEMVIMEYDFADRRGQVFKWRGMVYCCCFWFGLVSDNVKSTRYRSIFLSFQTSI